jgi:hypothetical protein
VAGGQAGALLDARFRGVHHLARDHATVADHEREAGRAVIQHEGAGVQFVVDVLGRAVVEVAVDGNAEGRRDVAGGGAGAKRAGLPGWRTGGRGRFGPTRKRATTHQQNHQQTEAGGEDQIRHGGGTWEELFHGRDVQMSCALTPLDSVHFTPYSQGRNERPQLRPVIAFCSGPSRPSVKPAVWEGVGHNPDVRTDRRD